MVGDLHRVPDQVGDDGETDEGDAEFDGAVVSPALDGLPFSVALSLLSGLVLGEGRVPGAPEPCKEGRHSF